MNKITIINKQMKRGAAWDIKEAQFPAQNNQCYNQVASLLTEHQQFSCKDMSAFTYAM